MSSKKQKTSTRPRVYARLRPMHGRDEGQQELFKIIREEGVDRLEYQREDAAEVSRYTFDKVFGMDATQQQVRKIIF